MISSDTIKFQKSGSEYFAYHKENGIFFFYGLNGNFSTHECACRDYFAMYWRQHPNQRTIGFHNYNGINIERVNEFWEIVENKLGFKKKEKKIAIHPTNYSDCIILEVPDFWIENKTRKSIFSLFLRASVIYFTGDFDRALLNYNLSYDCKPALDYFLKKNVYVVKDDIEDGHGFWHKYKNAPKDLIESNFAKRPIKPQGLISLKKIWRYCEDFESLA